MTLKDSLDIKDEYLSPIVIPNETILGWIKWDDEADFDSIVLRHEADVKINSLLDVDESVEKTEGKIKISKSQLQAGGFFGFNATYNATLDVKREICFNVDLIKGDKIETVTLTTRITKPSLSIIKSTCDQIIIDDFTPPPSSISFDITDTGDIPAMNPDIHISVTGDIKISSNRFSSEPTPFSNELLPEQEITIIGFGNGSGMIIVTIEYTDVLDNMYSEILQEIPVSIKKKNSGTIPIAKNISYAQEPPLLINS